MACEERAPLCSFVAPSVLLPLSRAPACPTPPLTLPTSKADVDPRRRRTLLDTHTERAVERKGRRVRSSSVHWLQPPSSSAGRVSALGAQWATASVAHVVACRQTAPLLWLRWELGGLCSRPAIPESIRTSAHAAHCSAALHWRQAFLAVIPAAALPSVAAEAPADKRFPPPPLPSRRPPFGSHPLLPPVRSGGRLLPRGRCRHFLRSFKCVPSCHCLLPLFLLVSCLSAPLALHSCSLSCTDRRSLNPLAAFNCTAARGDQANMERNRGREGAQKRGAQRRTI